ncbi:MAG: hypothetical protein V3S11_03910 [Elusimicrobiota bacterium]
MTRWLILLAVLTAASPAFAASAELGGAQLWQERFIWDGLLQARDRAARVSADPALVKVVNAIAHQVAQQSANLEQIQLYAKGQVDNIKFAFAQADPEPSLAVIQNNFNTLGKGTDQIRNNLYYLTTRTRLCSSQALADPNLTEKATLLIAQIQSVQLKLNTLYTDTAAVDAAVQAETWAGNRFFRYSSASLLKSVVSVQDSVFTVYNSAYELYILSKN